MLTCQRAGGRVDDVASAGGRGADQAITDVVIIEATLSIRIGITAWSRVALVVRSIRALLRWMVVLRARCVLALLVIIEVRVHGGAKIGGRTSSASWNTRRHL